MGVVPEEIRSSLPHFPGGRGVDYGFLHHPSISIFSRLEHVSQLFQHRRMRSVCSALLSTVVHVQPLNLLERLDVALVTDVVPFRRRCRGDGERGLKLVDEDLIAEPKMRRTWNTLQEEARACRHPLIKHHAVQVAGVDVDVVVVSSPEEVREFTLGGIDVVEVVERGRP